MRRADLQENLSLCYNLLRREREGYLYVCVGEKEVCGGGVYPEEIQIAFHSGSMGARTQYLYFI